MNNPFIEKIPSLFQGISRQAPSIRFPGQVADAKNLSFNVVDGARKRAGSEFIAALQGSTAETSQGDNIAPTEQYRMHRIERDSEEEYAIIYGPGVFQVLDMNKAEFAIIEAGAGADAGDPAAWAYVNNGNPSSEHLKFQTIADVTFIVNSRQTVRSTNDGEHLDATTMPVKLSRINIDPLTFRLELTEWKSRTKHHQVLTRTTAGNNDATFNLKFAGDKGSVVLPSDASAQEVEDVLQGNGYDPNDFLEQDCVTVFDPDTNESYEECDGNWVSVDPNVGTIDALAIDGLPAFPYGKVICTGGPLNYRPIKIRISPDLEVEDLIEVVEATGGSAYTMDAGENVKDPQPRFADMNLPADDRKISDIAFLRNRLVFSTTSYLVFSQTDDFYNFYMEEPPVLIDSDRFQIQIAGQEVTIVSHMVPFRRSLLIMATPGVQYEVRGTDVLAPGTANVTPTTRYELQNIPPAQFGDRLYMAGSAGGYSELLEYFYDESNANNRAANLTKHVDDLVPPVMRRLEVSPSQETVFAMPTLDGDLEPRTISTNATIDLEWSLASAWFGGVVPQPYDTARITNGSTVKMNPSGDGYGDGGGSGLDSSTISGKIFVYRAYTVGNERKQSAWSVWDFDDDALMDIAVFDHEILLMRKKEYENGEIALIFDTLDLGEAVRNRTGFSTPIHLDHLIETEGGIAHQGRTYWNLWDSDATGLTGYTDTGINRLVDFTGVEWEIDELEQKPNGTRVWVDDSGGDLVGTLVTIGRAVDAEMELSQVFVRDKKEKPLRDGHTKLKKINIEHRQTMQYETVLEHVDTLTPDRMETHGTMGEVELYGFTHMWVNGSSPDLTLTLKSDNAGPCTWTSVEWHGEYDTITE